MLAERSIKDARKKKDAKTEKATAAVEEEHLLSVLDMETENKVEYDVYKDTAVGFKCLDINDAYIKAKVVETMHLCRLN